MEIDEAAQAEWERALAAEQEIGDTPGSKIDPAYLPLCPEHRIPMIFEEGDSATRLDPGAPDVFVCPRHCGYYEDAEDHKAAFISETQPLLRDRFETLQRESDHRIKMLGDALGKILAKVGVIRDDVPVTGPELLNAAEAYTAGSAGDSEAPDAR